MKHGKLVKLAVAGLVSVLFLTACGETEDVSTKSKTEENGEEQSAKPEEKKGDSKIGSRSNPIKINEMAAIETVTYDNSSNEYKTIIELSVEEVLRGQDAQQKLKKMNEFNENAPEGYEWVLVKSKVKVADSETEDHPFTIDGIMNFKFVSENGDIYSGDTVATAEPDFSFEMYKGNEKEGYIAGLVKTGEDAKMEYDSWVGNTVFFDLK
ncbi:hypothetical protein DFO70_109219 [Cytobacillus firmus]|uniref:Lipoprotein n=2 Tax=Cytobacillus TaxID=2675230 RepID=A0A366JR16_CYTFI|nr:MULTISPECIES: hypothetical protein [Cytobacillus]RBP90712.1 hypothetical protein DFO70_109219 [Cytobacillus firmus]TDX46294.1 hypothetical protein DFO72_102776 [Cytobacillus oceanisediminis]